MTRAYRRPVPKAAAWAVPLLLTVLWQIVAESNIFPPRVLPGPWEVIQALVQLARSGELWADLRISAWRAAIGLAAGGTAGLLLGMATGAFRSAETVLDTTVQMLRNIPSLALLPLIILWFGIGEETKTLLIAIGVFFPIYLNTHHGIRAVDPALIEMGRSYGLDHRQLLREVILPGATPSILVGLRYALGHMWISLIVAETVAAQAGIGYLVVNAREFMLTDVVMVGILLYALLGKAADLAAKLLERSLLAWHPAYQPVQTK
ncbi:ABC transporter permease [Bordetella genomosp. 10]|uniref:ABC transporter permease n=1 Tax=Bordetella genomosp. 10 TaxID=1416804 RepID=A0A261SBY0_9BORD|nr:ABC transporter permease subunit [Bordetella genomosp. 10]OZI34665.1 ABC transporter permease [Bordetella genomosp. 10]